MGNSFNHHLSEGICRALSVLEKDGLVYDVREEINSEEDHIFAKYKIDIPQYPSVDIRTTEEVVLKLHRNSIIPTAYFTRSDFPAIPHLLRNTGSLKAPCLYQTQPEQIALNWNPLAYASSISNWLFEAVNNELHDKQALLEDNILADGGILLLPIDFWLHKNEYKYIKVRIDDGQRRVIELTRNVSQGHKSILPCVIDLGELAHSGIKSPPHNLSELAKFLNQGTTPFDFKVYFKTLVVDSSNYEKSILFLVKINVIDHTLSTNTDKLYSLYIDDMVSAIGLKLGVLDKLTENDVPSPIVSKQLDFQSSGDINVTSLTTHRPFNILDARLCNGSDISEGVHLPTAIQIGVGAIGSQISRNLTQSGVLKQLVIVDNDVLLPHNISRWVIADNVGEYKVNALAAKLNTLVSNEHYCVPYSYKIPYGDIDEQSVMEMKQYDLLIDTSASIPVQRTLDKHLSNSMDRVTVFLTPNGKNLVIAFTEKESKISHTDLEMVLYESIVSKKNLNTILDSTNKGFTYGGDSCRSFSFVISTHDISLLSSLASKFISSKSKSTSLTLFSIEEDLSVSRHDIVPPKFLDYESGGYKVKVSLSLLERLEKERANILPNETGGVLVGSYDRINDVIYVMASLPSPKDSVSDNKSYLRGRQGIANLTSHIENLTHSNLYYIGEWHSHPNGYSVEMSKSDLKQLSWLREYGERTARPLLQLIIGENNEININL